MRKRNHQINVRLDENELKKLENRCSKMDKKVPEPLILLGSGMVPEAGVEPARGISPPDFESGTSANSIIPAYNGSYYTTYFS